MSKLTVSSLAALALGLVVRTSSAETTALDRLQPAPAGDAFLSVPAATVGGQFRPAAALLAGWSHAPLRLRVLTPSGERTQQVVSSQATVHALASIDLMQTLHVSIDLPVALAQRGETSEALPAPGGAAIGDLRLGARVVLAKPSRWRPAVSLALSVWLPTGAGAYNGAPTVRAAPALLVGSDLGRVVWTLGLSRSFQPERADSLQSSEVLVTGGAAMRLGPLQIGPEFWVQHAVAADALGSDPARTSAEGLLAARFRAGSLVTSLAAGSSRGSLPGTPTYRVLAGVAFSPPVAPSYDIDAAPASSTTTLSATAPSRTAPAAVTTTQGGPAAARPLEPVTTLTPVAPVPDGDGDGIRDSQDACPAEAGVASLDNARHGCPADQDNDGITDAQDACPGEKGPASTDPKQNGCPRSVRVEGEQIVILQQVVFQRGRDVVAPESFGLLQQVADVLTEHPEIARLAVDGHTDSRGAEQANLDLSRRRAAAVLRWMTEHGVDARRLEARGFGPRRPITDNKTEDGRQKNRRVEFQILRRTKRGEAGWGEEQTP